MFTSFVLSAVLLAPAAPAPKVTKPVGVPPRLIAIESVRQGAVSVTVQVPRTVQQQVTVTVVENGVPVAKTETRDATVMEYQTLSLADTAAVFKTVGDQPLTAEEVNAKLKTGGVLIVPGDDADIDPAYTAVLTPETILVSYKKDEKKRITGTPRAPANPAPKVELVKAEDKGIVRVPAMGTKEVTLKVPVTVTENGETKVVYQDVKQTVMALVPSAFDDVKPDVTTADGKKVTADDAKKQLATGAVVLISRDGKPVDEMYRKLFKPTTLVLVAEKMISTADPTVTTAPPGQKPMLQLSRPIIE